MLASHSFLPPSSPSSFPPAASSLSSSRCSKRGLLCDLVVKGLVLLKKTCLLDLADELESHAQLPKIRVPLELPDVVHGKPDQHVEGHKSNADDKG